MTLLYSLKSVRGFVSKSAFMNMKLEFDLEH